MDHNIDIYETATLLAAGAGRRISKRHVLSRRSRKDRGTRWRSWLRLSSTNSEVAGSIPDGVIGISYCHNLSGRTIKLESNKFLTEMSTRDVSDEPNVFKSGTLRAYAGLFSLFTSLQERGEEHFILLCTIE